ncbi:MAG: EI24 domain-containing protein, partial [Gammaproteobacteria bacterium]
AGLVPKTEIGWINWIIEQLASFGVVFAILFLFPALASLVMGLFLDQIAAAVEQRYYPNDPPGVPVGIVQSMSSASKLAGQMLVFNLIALPFYIVFLFFPLLSAGLYYLINGYLLNREYFEMIALRHVDANQHKTLRRKHGGRLFVGGCLIAFLFSIPILNLTTPLLATGLMVHLFKGFEPGVRT